MSQLYRIRRVLTLDRGVYKEIRDDPKAMAPALTVMVLSILICSARQLIETPQGGIITLTALLLLWFVPSSLFYLLGKLSGGRSDYPGYLKASGYAQMPLALNIIPSVGLPIALAWWLICITEATRQTHEFSKRKAVFIVFVPIALTAVLASAMIASEAI